MKSNANNGYLVTLVDQAKVDGGRTLPLMDSASLATAKQEIEAGGRGLNDLALEALSGGNLDNADRLASEALSRNPSDLAARAIKDAIAKKAVAAPAAGRCSCPRWLSKRDVSVPAAGAPGDLNLQGDNAAASSARRRRRGQEINQNNALEEQWQKDVQNTINKARSQVAVNPDAAKALIQQKTTT